ncbi:beta transducin [Vermiconidia calcicola]|uniref:Beta transducin n=1 Tax=Vermiconidia calcicola TaxID=1690605 RepID=A0ACC3NH95_9PEZI|nr:beta transducin [Vermiconidia calcicola]
MVRSYRKYEATQTFGTVCTASSNSLWTPSSTTTRTTGAGKAYVGANEAVLCWDIKTSELLSKWHDSDNRSEVTCLTQCAVQPDLFAAGYNDGSIRIWDSLSGQVVVAFNGHRSGVTQLRFDREGARLVSGSRDTDIIAWNLLSEQAEFRLRGHKDQITGLEFLRTSVVGRRQSPHTDEAVDVAEEETEEKYLISTSKDALVKIWDLTSPHCVETHVAQTSGECWALGLSPDGAGFITAGNDGELRVWRLDLDALADLSDSGGEVKKRQDVLQSQGILHRQGKDRTIGVMFHPKQDYIAVHGSEKAVELWRIRGADEVHRHMQRKRRRRREKAAAAGEALQPETDDTTLGTPEVTDVFVPYLIVRTGGKVRSANWITGKGNSNKTLQLLIATTNNLLETYTITSHRALEKSSATQKEAQPDYNRNLTVELPGHRTDIRTLALSSDDRMLASASNGQLKVWNTKTRSCLRTLECGQALCSAFLPGDRIVLLGTKSGELEMWDISTSLLIDKVAAHEGAIWAMAVHPDGKSAVTGSADKNAKFWRFDVVEEEIPGTRRTTQRLKLTPTRQLKLADDILSLAFSPDQRLLALSTLDNTVKIFFTDSLKLFLTLYGHKLPVLSLSISSDSKLIATSSADKNVRIWGLDFGDCHKAFFAHNDSVMAVSFIPHPMEHDERHIIFSASKDGVVKSWDGDKFELIQRLEGHKGEVWAMVVGRTGELIVSASHDRSLRFWEVGDDLVFLEEERERELEEVYEGTLARNLERDARDEELEGQGEEVGVATKQTISTLTHGEKIVEALELGIEDLRLMQAYEREKETRPGQKVAPPQRNPTFLALSNISAETYVLQTLSRIPSSALNDALLVIPFSTLPTLFTFLQLFLENRMRPELAWRVVYFLLQVHMRQLVASRQLKPLLEGVLEAYEGWQEEQRRVIGFNLAGLEIMGREVREGGVGYVGDEVEEETGEDLGKGRRKRAFGSLA